MKLYISFELVEQIMMTMIGKNLGMNDNNKAVSKSGNPGSGPVPKTPAQIRIFFITSLLRH
jgi:hypothetical protein